MNNGLLLDQDLLLKLETLALATKSRIAGSMQGQRRSRHIGSSLEFADYRLYSPGDDIRQLDWHAYGRTGKPFIKLFMDEQEMQVHLYVDASQSMGFGATDEGSHSDKFKYACQLAACIGYIALVNYDRVSAAFFSDVLLARTALMRGRGSAHNLFQFLAAGEPSGIGKIDEAMMRPLSMPRQRGVVWLFSDFWYEDGIEETIGYVRAAGHEVVVVHVLSPQEISPDLSGDLRLIDSELKSGMEVAMSSAVWRAYEAALEQHTHALRRFCYDQHIPYVLATTDMALTDAVFKLFYKSGIVV